MTMSDSLRDPKSAPSVTRDPSFLDTYANQVRINVQVTDFTVIFMVNDDQGTDRVKIMDKAAVRLPPVAAKILALQLHSIIEIYEQTNGKIPLPANFDKYLEDAKSRLIAGFSVEEPSKATRARK